MRYHPTTTEQNDATATCKYSSTSATHWNLPHSASHSNHSAQAPRRDARTGCLRTVGYRTCPLRAGDRRYPIIHRKGLAHNGSGFSLINRGIRLYPVLLTASSYRGGGRAYDREFIELPSRFRGAACVSAR